MLPIILFRMFEPKKNRNFKSFLIVRLDHIGDVVLSTPIYRSLKERFPESKITVLCGSWSTGVLTNNPFIDTIIELDCPWWTTVRKMQKKKSGSLRSIITCIIKIKKERYDVFIDLRGDIRHIFLFGWLPNIPIRISNTRSGGSFLLTHVREYINNSHEIERNYDLLAFFSHIKKYMKTEIYPNEAMIESLKSKTHSLLDIDSEAYVVLFNGGQSRLRRVSLTKLAALIKELIKQYPIKCCLVGGEVDYPDSEDVKLLLSEYNDRLINFCGKLSFSEIAQLIQRSRLFIGTDSSLLHISASTNTPTIAIFGPTQPSELNPIGSNKTYLYHHYPCSPCLQLFCPLTESKTLSKCMDDVAVEEILTKIKSLKIIL